MSVVIETSEPFSEIEREVRKLERLLNRKTMEVEIFPGDTRHHAIKRTDVAILPVEQPGPVPPGDRQMDPPLASSSDYRKPEKVPLRETAQRHVESSGTEKVAAVNKFMLHRIAVVVVAAALGSAAIATDAAARGGSGAGLGGGSMGGGHIGGAMGGGRIGGGLGGGHIGGGRFAGRFDHRRHGRARGLAAPFGYYDDWYSGNYDPSTVTPDEQPTYPTTAYPYVKPPRSSCSTQTYKVPSEAGGEASINVVRC